MNRSASANQAAPPASRCLGSGVALAPLQLFVAVFEFVIGALMLIAPHQYALPHYAPLLPHITLWGAVFLLSAGSMAAALVIIRQWRLLLLAHLFAGTTLLLLAYLLAAAANWIGLTVYGILGLGVLAAPLAQPSSLRLASQRGNPLRILMALVALGVGLNFLLAPDKVFWAERSYLAPAPWLAAAFFVAAATLTATLLLKPSQRTPIRLAHLAAAVPFAAYPLVGPLPLRAWTGIVFYFSAAILLAALPWLEERAHLIDLDSLHARLALALSAGAVIPLLVVVPIALSMQEEAAIERSLAQHRALAEDAAQELADFVSHHTAAIVGLAGQPGLLDAPAAAQRQALRALQAAYPAVFLMASVDPQGAQIARSDDQPLISLANTPVFQQVSQMRQIAPVLGLRWDPAYPPILSIISPAVNEKGEVKGFVALGVETSQFDNVFARIPTMGAAAAYLVDEQGRVIAATGRPATTFADLSEEPSVAALLGGREAGSFVHGQSPASHIVGYAPVAGLSWTVIVEEPVASVVAESRRQRDSAFPVILLVGALAAAASVALSRSMVQPLREVVQTVGGIAGGSFDAAPAPSPAVSELRQLSEAVAQMSERLAQASAERDDLLTEAQRHAVELEIVNMELDAYNYSVSHDLKTPLRAMEGFSRALLEGYGDKLDGEGKRYLATIHRNSRRMDALLDAMLELSRINRAELKPEPVDLSRMAHNIAEGLKSTAPERQVEFVIAPDISAVGDKALLRVMMENLLSNAWKFTSKHATARIEFGVTQRDGKPVYFVRDDGIGFDMEYAGKLFVAFERLHSESEFPGLGIGLATVQRVVRRHGGHIWAEAEVEKGAAFYFTLG